MTTSIQQFAAFPPAPPHDALEHGWKWNDARNKMGHGQRAREWRREGEVSTSCHGTACCCV